MNSVKMKKRLCEKEAIEMLLERSDKELNRNQATTGASVIEEPVHVLRIAVCDDEAPQLEKFRQIFDEVKISIQLQVECFVSAEALLEELQKCRENDNDFPDIIFCDIKMPKMDGITFGKKIREFSGDIYLVLFTAYPEYAIKGYETRAFRYLLKPVMTSDIEQVLCNILQEMGKCKKLLVRMGEAEYVRPLADIVYISSENKYTVLYTKDGHYVDFMSLNDYEKMLDVYGFCRIHRKHLVNLAWHQSMSKGEVTLMNGTKLPISRRKEAVYRERLLQMLGERLEL